MPIAVRLGLGFLVPALLAAIALGGVGIRSQQLLSHESKYFQILVDSYTTLKSESDMIQQIHANLLGLQSDAGERQPSPTTITEDLAIIDLLTSRFDVALDSYLRADTLDHSPDLVALLADAGHSDQVRQQAQDTAQFNNSWDAYAAQQREVSESLKAGKVYQASFAEVALVEPAYANVMSSLLRLLQFTNTLAPSIHDALNIEESRLLFDATLAAFSILIGIGIVGWLVFYTVARRLQKARRVMKVIEGGQIETRLPVVGRDEITSVCSGVNGMLDTIVGLLEETRQQRDELASAEELKQLHQELQSKHEALNEANARLEALATTDPLTGLPNHRTVMGR
ncbi:MAG TPA: HAMP domain-containing protein, partial [Ktedonobacteraceae bacterium]|nr:HAMP domain-containing protein [Ktedonobacteraceae bacterium]